MRRRLPRYLAARSSVRTRTTLLASLVVGVALVVGAVVLLLTLERSLVRSDDNAAKSRARDLAALAVAGTLPPTLTASSEDGISLVVEDGRVLAHTPGAPRQGAIATFAPEDNEPVVRTVHDVPYDGEPGTYRVWALTERAADGPVTVYVGTNLETVSETMATMKGLLAVMLPVMLGLLAFSTWVLIGRALHPVEAIRAEVADISDTELDRRVPVPAAGDEVGRLATTMNAMLDRLEAASRRQRNFVADASHELQSPLASFRTQLEVALTYPAGTDWHAMAKDLLADSDRMERLVRDLLFLARNDATRSEPSKNPVDLDDLVLDEAARLRAGTQVRIDTSRVSAAPVRGSPEELARLTRNLLENAVRHAATEVTVELSTRDGHVELVVEDDGPGVPQKDRQRIFDRFVRLDDARSRDDGGTGLGLAIVRAIATRHDGTVAVEDGHNGARFVVRIRRPEPPRLHDQPGRVGVG